MAKSTKKKAVSPIAESPAGADTASEDLDWNDEIEEDLAQQAIGDLVVYSRDWTIETILNQIAQKNIDLNPKFQRRNAWDDGRRSKLIESLIAGRPVPEIVLAEDKSKPKAFLVIDGKQRLLTIAGFVDPTIGYWKKPELKGLKLLKTLNDKTYQQMKDDPAFADQHRAFLNADVRCAVISGFTSDDVLYDIFYRLNTGSVPLSTQELRQVLKKGAFADYLIEITNTPQPIHRVLGTQGPDTRLKDIEIVLRFISIALFGSDYRGNLKTFLDNSMGTITAKWDTFKPKVEKAYADLNKAIENLVKVLGGLVGRKYTAGKWEPRFNRVLFEAEAFYFRSIPVASLSKGKAKFVAGLQRLFESDDAFRSSIETTTKTNANYVVRFKAIRDLVNKSFGTAQTEMPITA